MIHLRCISPLSKCYTACLKEIKIPKFSSVKKKKKTQRTGRNKNTCVQRALGHLKVIRSAPGTPRTLGQVFFTWKYVEREEGGWNPISSGTKHKREKYLPHESERRDNLCHRILISWIPLPALCNSKQAGSGLRRRKRNSQGPHGAL